MRIFSKVQELEEVYWIGGIIGVLLIVLLVFSMSRSDKQEDNSPTVTVESLLAEENNSDALTDDGSSSRINNTEAVHDVVVDVKGAVNKPGVFSLTSSQRVIDAIEAAAGLTEDADPKRINFAQLLVDEMFIYIPVEGEEVEGSSGSSEALPTEGAKININDANEQTLLQLNGIGPSKANEIIKHREANGPFETIHDITNVSGIGEKTFEKIQEFIEIR